MEVPWGHKALGAYLGEDRAKWAEWDACALVKAMRERRAEDVAKLEKELAKAEQKVASSWSHRMAIGSGRALRGNGHRPLSPGLPANFKF